MEAERVAAAAAKAVADSVAKVKAREGAARELKRLEAKLGVDVDEFDGTRTVGLDRGWFPSVAERGWGVTMSLTGAANERPMLSAMVATQTEEWIFWDEIVVNVDGIMFRFPVDSRLKRTKVLTGQVAEWAALPVMQEQVASWMGIATGKVVKFRFSGREGIRDVVVTAAQKKHILDCLQYALFQGMVLGGE